MTPNMLVTAVAARLAAEEAGVTSRMPDNTLLTAPTTVKQAPKLPKIRLVSIVKHSTSAIILLLGE